MNPKRAIEHRLWEEYCVTDLVIESSNLMICSQWRIDAPPTIINAVVEELMIELSSSPDSPRVITFLGDTATSTRPTVGAMLAQLEG